jgi:superfamily II RNA helicase
MDDYLDIVPDDRKVEISDPAITYPFELDNFQKFSQYYIQEGENVLVTAHTSAGKTVVAEAGIAHAKRLNKRAFYTSPIKTLSNQKYFDFNQKFGDVGLLTGDIKCNPDAQCMIMTTEILRDMLYKEDDPSAFDNLECVIFDEVHYINNPERGHVWEECIIKLPSHVTLILLSATISESEKFARWVANVKQRPIHLISTLKRPVPLNHYAFVNDEMRLILNEKGVFDNENYRLYFQDFNILGQSPSFRAYNLLNPFISYLKKHQLNPAIFFVFSRKKCETFASKVQIGLTTSEEQAQINKQIDKYLVKHSLEKKVLDVMPQIMQMRALLVKGIGVHHSGLLPIMKEIVEILFSQGLVKVLFATETFAVGVNMPTRTVVFTALEKYCDNNDYPRLLKPDEYLQMSGRAGRRGLDSFGTVVHLPLSKAVDPMDAKNLLLGKSSRIVSKFKVNYPYVLQMLYCNHGDSKQVTHQSYLFQQYMENISKLKEDTIEIQQQMDYLKQKLGELGVPEDKMAKVKELIDLQDQLANPGSFGGIVIRLNRKQEKKIQGQIKKLKSQLSSLKSADQAQSLIVKYNEYESDLKKIEEDIDYYENVMGRKYRYCLNELREMGYVNYDDDKDIFELTKENLTNRGLIAARIASANEILLTELIVDGRLEKLDLPVLAAVLSVFCESSRSKNNMFPWDQFHSTARKSVITKDANELIDWVYSMCEDYSRKSDVFYDEIQERGISDSFSNAAFLWAQGIPYLEILPQLETFEGNFIRNMLRISNICDEITRVCEVYPNAVLEKNVSDLKATLLRDVVSFDSLYLKS